MATPCAFVPMRSANSSVASLTSSIGGGTRGKVIMSGCTGIERSTIRFTVLPRSSPGRPPLAFARRSPEHLDDAGRAVDADAVAGLDALAGVAGAHDGRDAELARDDGRVRDRAAGLRDETLDLGEEHDPGRVRHAADEDVALLDLVELLERRHVACGSLDHAGRRRQALDLARRGGLAGVEAVGEAPEAAVGELDRGLRRRAEPRRRPALVGVLV